MNYFHVRRDVNYFLGLNHMNNTINVTSNGPFLRIHRLTIRPIMIVYTNLGNFIRLRSFVLRDYRIFITRGLLFLFSVNRRIPKGDFIRIRYFLGHGAILISLLRVYFSIILLLSRNLFFIGGLLRDCRLQRRHFF